MRFDDHELNEMSLSECVGSMDPHLRNKLRMTTYMVAWKLMTGGWTWETLTEEALLIHVILRNIEELLRECLILGEFENLLAGIGLEPDLNY